MDGVLTPGALASPEEMKALCRAIDEGGGGVFSANMDFGTYDDVARMEGKKMKAHWQSEWNWLDEVAEQNGSKVNMTFEVGSDTAFKGHKPEYTRMAQVEGLAERHGDKGFTIRTQCHVRPQGFLQAAHSRLNLLLLSKSFRDLLLE